jgi:hypothetical protein
MRRTHFLQASLTDLEILLKRSPMTAKLSDLACKIDFHITTQREPNPKVRAAIRAAFVATPICSSTDPWSDLQYQSLYITDDFKDRLVLQEPATDDPTVGIMVLKAARLRGESGMVYCGTPEQLKSFAEKLPQYEERGEELKEEDLLDCLSEAAEAEGIKIVYLKLAPEHGGEKGSDREFDR